MNVANSLLIMAFVVVPEWLADSQADVGRLNRTRHIKEMPQKVAVHADELNSVLDFGVSLGERWFQFLVLLNHLFTK
jgi:hypothetical protein